jgi:hypothetical protein
MSVHWRHHPRLKGRFHEQAPDDIQVLVHDGGPRLSRVKPEVVWVRVTSGDGDLLGGTVLNRPKELATVSAGATIRFKVPASGELPLLVTDRYLSERPDWIIQPCSRCGLTELFDAPSDLLRVVFPPGAEQMEPEVFTAICGWCGGVQVVQRVGTEAFEPAAGRKRWWQFWR